MKELLLAASDECVFEEAVKRLRSFFKRNCGLDLKNGSFHIVMHHGRFQCIEAHPKIKGYLSPSRFGEADAQKRIG